MNQTVEIHDSRLGALTWRGQDLIVSLAPASVHQSEGRPAIDPGDGGVQDLGLVLHDAVVTALPLDLPCDLSDGSFAAGSTRWDNLIPLPCPVCGPVTLTAVTTANESLQVQAHRATLEPRGAWRRVESFPGSSG